MRTSELIAALAADPVPEPIRLGRRVAAALVDRASSAASRSMVCCLARGRTSPRPPGRCASGLKFVDSFAFALPSLLLTLRLARPGRQAEGAGALAPRAVPPARRRRGRGIAGRAAKRVDVPAHRHELDALHDDDSDPGRAHARGADRRAARRRAAPPGPDRRARRRGLRRRRGAALRLALPGRFAACSWRPGIRSRRSSARASARWPGGGFWPGEGAQSATS